MTEDDKKRFLALVKGKDISETCRCWQRRVISIHAGF